MKRNIASAIIGSFFAVLILFLAASIVRCQESQPFSIDNSPLPAPTGFVNDYAGVIDAATKQQLEDKIKKFKESTNPQVELAVAVVRTTGDRPIFDYSLAVARGWKIGSKNDDNPSALLFVAIDDRKYFTQVSKDLEDELPDGLVGSLQRQYLVPEFRRANYAKGISDTIDAYIRTIQERSSGSKASPTPERGINGVSESITGLFCCLVIILVLGLIIVSNLRRSRKTPNDRNRWGGGFGGGDSALPWIIGGIIGSSGGSGSSSSDWGGSSGSSSSDWGGFGGGGDFGGGGAGGDW